MIWDKANLTGKGMVNDITETARKYVPEMRKQGADVVVAPSGLSSEPYQAMAENSVDYFSPGAWRGRYYVRPCSYRIPGERFCQYERG